MTEEIERISCFDCYEIVEHFCTNGNEEELRCPDCALAYYKKNNPFSMILINKQPGSINWEVQA